MVKAYEKAYETIEHVEQLFYIRKGYFTNDLYYYYLFHNMTFCSSVLWIHSIIFSTQKRFLLVWYSYS